MGGKDGCKGRLEAATISDILYLFGQGNFIFIREKSGNFEKLMSVATMSCYTCGFLSSSDKLLRKVGNS